MQKTKHPLEEIVQNDLCMGCGMCAASFRSSQAEVQVKMAFDPHKDSFVPTISNWQAGMDPGQFICPGQKMDMVQLAQQVHGEIAPDYLLGHYKKLRIGYAEDPDIRKNAASGGAIPAIITYLFQTQQIDAVYCLHPGEGPYQARGVIIRCPEELSQVHGSVYHPFDYGHQLDQLIKGNHRFAFVGLPCQIAGLEMLKQQFPELSERHVLSVGLFCGGVNTFKGIAYYLKGFQVPWDSIQQISYRIGDWPGKIKLSFKQNDSTRLIPRIRGNSRWKILRYVIGFQGYWMLKRCRLCPDQISDFADIAVGDPHLPQYRAQGGAGFSAIISRTKRGEKVLSDMIQSQALGAEVVEAKSIIDSQGYTLDNRRHLWAYLKVNQILGGRNPDIRLHPNIAKHVSFRHYVYAWVDLLKLKIPKNKLIEILYIPWQIFEYLFITFTPNLILKRLLKLIRNQ